VTDAVRQAVRARANGRCEYCRLSEPFVVLTFEVEHATREEQLALLRAHPDLGARARMSEASLGEQSGAGLDRLTPKEYDHLRALNEAYRHKFGFPFLFAVKGATKHDILVALEQRSHAAPEQEFLEALKQVYRIAWFRLEALVQPEKGGS